MKRRERERAPIVRLVGGGTALPEARPASVATAPVLARTDRDGRVLDLVAPILTLKFGERIGWALQWDDEHLTSGVVSFDAGSTGPGLGLVRFRTWLGELLDLSQAVLVGYEALSPRERAVVLPGGASLLHLEGVLLARLEGRVAYVAPRREEVRANLVGRSGAYRRLLDAARRRWDMHAESDEEAHALAVLAWVVDVIGDPGQV